MTSTLRETLERALEMAQIVENIIKAQLSGELTAAEAAEITTVLTQQTK